jgi:hypothetical protein
MTREIKRFPQTPKQVTAAQTGLRSVYYNVRAQRPGASTASLRSAGAGGWAAVRANHSTT